MNLETTLLPPAPPACSNCNVLVADSDAFCQGCGFPLQGTEQEQSDFQYRLQSRQLDLEDSEKKMRRATTSLYVLAGIFVLAGIIYYFTHVQEDTVLALLITNLVLAITFLLLALWSRKKPVAAIISGLVLYLGVQLLNAIVEPVSIFQGIILKVAIIIYLVKGLLSSLEAQTIRRELNIR